MFIGIKQSILFHKYNINDISALFIEPWHLWTIDILED